ncbi:MAG: NAD(P)/FAD-dependent oxidoreductase [Clostridia bacterium]|nr:NAD(P)/FAD-dependent oxidoreductase [Clostridia bacterium]
MGKRIIVAGAGHGGLSAAAGLSKRGFDVTVIEQKKECELGYDWTDIFDPKSFSNTGIPYPAEELFEYKENMTFFNPSLTVPVRQNIPKDELEIKMERSDIYKHLIAHARNCGVKFMFETPITAPIVYGSRVCGVRTGDSDIFADLVIDACGIDSVIRTSLPDVFGIEKAPAFGERAHAYRAFYERVGDFCPEHNYEVYLMQGGEKKVAWVATEEGFTDVLIVRFDEFGSDEVEKTLSQLRKSNPHIGEKILRGGQFVHIPIRQPLAVLVADGYAAIGDSAFMTVPLIGSGIANSLKASAMLINTILDDHECAFTAASLWKYQNSYYKYLGEGFAVLSTIKSGLFNLLPAEIDYLFETGFVNESLINISANFTGLKSLNLTPKDIASKAKALCTDRILLTKLIRIASQVASAKAITAMMPTSYSQPAVARWSEKYTSFFSKL